ELDLGELALVEGRFADAARHAAQARDIAARRTDLRVGTEARLLLARIACAGGDRGGIDTALAAIEQARINAEQQAILHAMQACAGLVDGDAEAAALALAQARQAAAGALTGKLEAS